MRARCINRMHLQPAENGTDHYAMDLQTGQDIIKGEKITVTPLTDTMKNTMERVGIKQGFKRLKF